MQGAEHASHSVSRQECGHPGQASSMLTDGQQACSVLTPDHFAHFGWLKCDHSSLHIEEFTRVVFFLFFFSWKLLCLLSLSQAHGPLFSSQV